MKNNDLIAKMNEVLKDKILTISEFGKNSDTLLPLITLIKEKVQDERVPYLIKYKIEDVVIQCFLALLAGAKSFIDMRDYGLHSQKFLKRYCGITNFPSHDTITRIFKIIDSRIFEECVSIYISQKMEAIGKKFGLKVDMEQICIDGKEERNTGRNYNNGDKLRNIQILNVYNATYHINYYSIPIPSKKNEIPVAQECLKKMNIKDKLITGDAMHMQIETLRIIKEKGGLSLFGLKGNHEILLEDCKKAFINFKEKKDNTKTFDEKNHSQLETRTFRTIPLKQTSIIKELPGIETIVEFTKKAVSTHLDKNGKAIEKTEVRYYLTSLKEVETIADGIRNHWSVENGLHFYLDEQFGEDRLRILDKNCMTNYSILAKLALSFLKIAKPILKAESINGTRNYFRWDIVDAMKTLLTVFAMRFKLKNRPKK